MDLKFILPVVLLLVLVALVRLFAGRSGEKTSRSARPAPLAVEPVAAFFTPPEAAFQQVLLLAVEGLPVLACPKVRLLDAVKARSGDAYTSTRNKIGSSHLDWLLVEAGTWRPLAAIELDGRSHGTDRQRNADANKDEALRQAGLPVWRYANRAQPPAAELRSRIAGLLAAPDAPQTPARPPRPSGPPPARLGR